MEPGGGQCCQAGPRRAQDGSLVSGRCRGVSWGLVEGRTTVVRGLEVKVTVVFPGHVNFAASLRHLGYQDVHCLLEICAATSVGQHAKDSI